MARDILDLGADVFDDVSIQKKRRISPKKRNYIIGLSCLGLILAGAITFTVIAANTWLLDLENLQGIQFYYAPKDPDDPNSQDSTLTLYRLSPDIEYPSTFRIPEKVLGHKVTAVAPQAFNGHKEIKEVIFTSYVDTVGAQAFAGCTGITNFRWNKALINIGEGAFDDTAYYKKLKEDSKNITRIPSGIIINIGSDYLKTKSEATGGTGDNLALVSDDFDQKADVMAKYGIPATNFISFKDLGEDEGETTGFIAGLFQGNEQIAYLDFPEFLKSLGEETFKGCPNLKAVDFSHSIIANITKGNFLNCTALTDISFSESIVELGESAFENTKVTALPGGLDEIAKIGDRVFANCSKLQKVYFPDSEKLTKVPNYMFYKCSSLTEFYWGDEDNLGGNYIKSIGVGAFEETPLTEFYVPQSVTTIRDEAFKKCTNLESLYLYGNPNEYYDEDTIDKDDYGVYKYATLEDNGDFSLSDYDTNLNIELENHDAFTVLPDTDGNYLFEIDNPSSEIAVDKATFTLTAENYEIIKEAVVKQREEDEKETSEETSEEESESEDEGEEEEGLYVMAQDDTKLFAVIFEQDTKSKEFKVTLKSTATYTQDDDGNYHIGYLAGVSDIRQDAFDGCTSLETIALYSDAGYEDVYTPAETFTFPKSLTWLSKSEESVHEKMYIFRKTNAKHIYIDSHVRKIGGFVFSKMASLVDVTFSDKSKLQSIGEEAFSENPGLTSISIPSSVSIIGAAAFYNCSNLTNIDIKNTKIISIGTELFSGCEKLEHVDLPETVNKINEKSFKGTSSLDYIVIPRAVNNMAKFVFSNCANTERGNLPIYLNLTLSEYESNYAINKQFHDDTCDHFLLLGEGEEKVEGNRYWNGDATNPQEI